MLEMNQTPLQVFSAPILGHGPFLSVMPLSPQNRVDGGIKGKYTPPTHTHTQSKRAAEFNLTLRLEK